MSAQCPNPVASSLNACCDYRDPDFDLEYDQYRCTQGLGSGKALTTGKDVQRGTEIFDNPIFFPAGGSPNSSAIRQGALGDCYFLSALATVSSLPGLIEKICVAVRPTVA